MMLVPMALDAIEVGTRIRKDLGDIAGLADSIQERGLLQPILTNTEGQLVAGFRRIAALRHLGTAQTEVLVLDGHEDPLAMMAAELDENTQRKDFLPSEVVAGARVLEALEREAAKRRQGGPGRERSGKLPERSGGDTRDRVAAAFGVSGKTLEKAKIVVESGHGDLIEEMDASGKVDRAYHKARHRAECSRLAEREVAPPDGLYDVIVVDPPWPMSLVDREIRPGQVEMPYPTMTLDEIEGLQIPCADNCHVWLWTTQGFLRDAQELLDSWGLKYVCQFIWHKNGGFQPINLPMYNAEFALYARRGSPRFTSLKAFNTCFTAPRGKHSEKPAAFYEMVRRATTGRRLDMFNRRPIEGFDGWGNEAGRVDRPARVGA